MLRPDLYHRLVHQYQEVEFLVSDLSDDFLRTRHQPDKWSIQEHLAHLGCYQDNFKKRLIQIQQENQPEFERYKAEEDPQFEQWLSLDVKAILFATNQSRSAIAKWIRSLDEKVLKRTGHHPKFGWMDMAVWTEFFLLHESHHLYAIFRLKQAFGN